MAGGARKHNQVITEINVTPFVDVILVLLIIFMVTANYLNKQAIEVDLPQAATGESQNENTNLGFVIDAQSNIYLDGIIFNLTDLPSKIAQLKSQGKSLQALIGADKNAKHGRVVELIDELRINGVTDFALDIETKG